MSKTKMTKKDYFAKLLTVPGVSSDPALVSFIEHELELLSKKNASDRKPTEKQVLNASIARAVVEVVNAEPNRLFTISEFEKIVPNLPEDMTNQRMSAIVRSLLPNVGTGEVIRVEDKRKVYFKANPDFQA